MRKIARGRLECASLVLKPAKWCFWGPILTTCGTPEETYPEFSYSLSMLDFIHSVTFGKEEGVGYDHRQSATHRERER
jgi:hypothetical protein